MRNMNELDDIYDQWLTGQIDTESLMEILALESANYFRLILPKYITAEYRHTEEIDITKYGDTPEEQEYNYKNKIYEKLLPHAMKKYMSTVSFREAYDEIEELSYIRHLKKRAMELEKKRKAERDKHEKARREQRKAIQEEKRFEKQKIMMGLSSYRTNTKPTIPKWVNILIEHDCLSINETSNPPYFWIASNVTMLYETWQILRSNDLCATDWRTFALQFSRMKSGKITPIDPIKVQRTSNDSSNTNSPLPDKIRNALINL